MTPFLNLAFGISFPDLYAPEGLARVDRAFVDDLRLRDAALAERLLAARADPDSLAKLDESTLLLAVAPFAEAFIGRLFGIEDAVEALIDRQVALAPLFHVKRRFVQRQAARTFTAEEAASFDADALRARLAALLGGTFDEDTFAARVAAWMQSPDENADALDVARRYAAWAVHTDAGRERHRDDVVFRTPQGVDPMFLVPPMRTAQDDGMTVHTIAPDHIRRRRGFSLTDPGGGLKFALDQANYCIWCHAQGRDSCRTGLKNKGMDRGREAFKTTAFGVPLAGCPLEERISEFQQLKAEGVPIGALATICIDNPMVAATGHRICNDCMMACIYQ